MAGALGFKRSKGPSRSGYPRSMATAMWFPQLQGGDRSAAAAQATTTAAALNHLQHSLLSLVAEHRSCTSTMISQRQEEGGPGLLKTAVKSGCFKLHCQRVQTQWEKIIPPDLGMSLTTTKNKLRI